MLDLLVDVPLTNINHKPLLLYKVRSLFRIQKVSVVHLGRMKSVLHGYVSNRGQ